MSGIVSELDRLAAALKALVNTAENSSNPPLDPVEDVAFYQGRVSAFEEAIRMIEGLRDEFRGPGLPKPSTTDIGQWWLRVRQSGSLAQPWRIKQITNGFAFGEIYCADASELLSADHWRYLGNGEQPVYHAQNA